MYHYHCITRTWKVFSLNHNTKQMNRSFKQEKLETLELESICNEAEAYLLPRRKRPLLSVILSLNPNSLYLWSLSWLHVAQIDLLITRIEWYLIENKEYIVRDQLFVFIRRFKQKNFSSRKPLVPVFNCFNKSYLTNGSSVFLMYWNKSSDFLCRSSFLTVYINHYYLYYCTNLCTTVTWT